MRWVLLLALSSCYHVTAPKLQAPVYDVPLGTRIALVAIDGVDASQCDAAAQPGDLRAYLDESFAQRGYPVDDDASSAAPLRLSIKVATWPCPQRSASDIDITFEMRHRDGTLVETQRVIGTITGASDVSGNLVRVEPGRGNGFRNGTTLIGWLSHARNAKNLAAAAVDLFAAAYMPTLAGWYAAELDPDGGKRGIELARDGKWVDAIREFQRVGNSAALFNIGQLLVIAGLDRSALVYFKRAVEAGIPRAEHYLEACRQRIAYQKPLAL